MMNTIWPNFSKVIMMSFFKSFIIWRETLDYPQMK